MKHLKIFETYSETELTEYKGLDLDEILSRSRKFIEWRRLSTTNPDGSPFEIIAEIEKVVIRNNGTIYISWKNENGTSFHHNVFDKNVYYKFIEDPELYKAVKKYNL